MPPVPMATTSTTHERARDDIAVIPGPGALANVSIFDALTTQLLGNFPAFSGFLGGAFIGSVGR